MQGCRAIIGRLLLLHRVFPCPPAPLGQIPRLYNVYKEQGIIDNFEQLLSNIFAPLFEVTLDPASHPQLHIFLQMVGGGEGQHSSCITRQLPFCVNPQADTHT